MSLVSYLVRAQLRRRWQTWVGLVVLIAVGGGTALFAFSAAQRTSTAMDRFLEAFKPGNAIAIAPSFDHEALLARPGIIDAETGEYFFLVPHGADGPDVDRLGDVNPFSSAYGRMLHTMNIPKVIAGRMPDPGADLEIAVDEELAEAYGVGPGDTFTLTGITPEQFGRDEAITGVAPEGPTFDFTVTAILRRPSDVVPAPGRGSGAVHLGTRDMVLTPAFHDAHYRKDVAGGSYFDEEGAEYMELVVAPDTSLEELQAQVAEVAPEAQVFPEPSEDAVATSVADRAIGLQASAMLAVAVVVAVVASLFLALGLSRVLGDQAREAGPLLASGLSRRSLRAVTAMTGGFVTVVGTVGAVLVTYLLSPLGPVGLARRAETDPGFHLDAQVTALGGVLILAIALAITAGVAARHGRALDPSPAGPTALPARFAGQASDVAVATGLRFAGRRTGSRTATQLTVVLACLAVVGTLTFASSAAATVREPDRYGWTWALAVGNPNDPELYHRLVEELPGHPAVGAATVVHDACGGALDLGDRHAEAPLVALEPLTGAISPEVRSGRIPGRPGEVALGAVTARALGAGVGDVVEVASADCGAESQPLTVTGIAVFNDALLANRVGEGALLDASALPALGVEPGQGMMLVDPSDDLSTAEAQARLRADYGRVVAGPIVPGDLDALDRVRALPLVIAAFVGLLALGTLGFTLGAGLRRSRRDLAVLKSLGFTPAQARRTTFVHAVALVTVPALIGTALGVAAGRLAWGLVADGLGTIDLPRVPIGAAVVTIPIAIFAAALIAVRPAVVAGRTAPSLVLRAE